jgi:tetratricopeptide (TPR) repeat protein
MKWSLKGSSITRNHLAVLDILANNNWERPIYFAVTVGGDNYLGLQKYFRVEGLAYRVVPVLANSSDGQTGEIYTDAMYERMVNEFEWGNMHMPDVYHGTETERMSLNYRSMFGRLAKQLIVEDKREEALATLNRCIEAIPHESIPYNFSMIGAVEAYIELGEHEKGIDIANKLADLCADQIRYYAKFDKKTSEDARYRTTYCHVCVAETFFGRKVE